MTPYDIQQIRENSIRTEIIDIQEQIIELLLKNKDLTDYQNGSLRALQKILNTKQQILNEINEDI